MLLVFKPKFLSNENQDGQTLSKEYCLYRGFNAERLSTISHFLFLYDQIIAGHFGACNYINDDDAKLDFISLQQFSHLFNFIELGHLI